MSHAERLLALLIEERQRQAMSLARRQAGTVEKIARAEATLEKVALNLRRSRELMERGTR